MRVAALLAAIAGALALATPAGAVVGGTDASLSDYPFFARVGPGQKGCGGALVAPDRVVTAAHCLSLAGIGGRVRIGPDAIERHVDLLATHPVGFREQRRVRGDAVIPADLLLLGLDSPVTEVAPVRVGLPEESLTAPGTLATTIGFGAARLSGKGSGRFRSGTVRIQNPASCDELFNALWRRWALCTRDPRLPDPAAQKPFVSACFGDSGSPLLVDPGDGPRLVGTDSFGQACGTEHDPEIYANAVAAAASFILAENPPWAPRASGKPRISGRVAVGKTISCEVEWLVEPSQSTEYYWVSGRRTIPSGRTLRVRSEYEGRQLRCVASGRTAGGFTIVRSAAARVG